MNVLRSTYQSPHRSKVEALKEKQESQEPYIINISKQNISKSRAEHHSRVTSVKSQERDIKNGLQNKVANRP